jgi:peptidyl-dipeptidase Dcp
MINSWSDSPMPNSHINLPADLLSNPLAVPSKLPHGAFPFDQLKKEHFKPALDHAIKDAKAKLEAIRSDKSPATFENTILALETCSEGVQRVGSIFFNLLGTNTDEELQSMAREISPRLADFSSDVLLDPLLFQRVKAAWENRAPLKSEELRLTEKSYKDFARNGALLNDADKERLRAIDQALSTLSPEFSDNVLKATNDFKMILDMKSDLEGLPESTVEAAAQAAKEASLEGNWLFNLHGPSYVPFLTYSANRALREKMWRAYNSRAFRDSHTNEAVAKKLAQLRHDRATLLGYKTHANFVLEERMAEKPEKVLEFLERLLDKTRPAALRDVEAVRALKKELSGSDDMMPWDYSYYSEKLKMRAYDLDQEELRPYFKLENVIQGVFEHARQLYGLKFKEITGIPVYHPDVKTFEVIDEDSGRFIGLFYADFFPRESKRGGAWMSSFQEQGLQGGKVERPHVTIVCNFTKPTATKPSLLTFEEVSTLFHEFGHSLHGLLSDCKYVSLAGTNVYWDFVELPSQIMENWTLEKEALDLFATHYETGKTIPKEFTDKIRASARFQAGHQAVRQLQFALLDMAWHSQDPSTIDDIDAFEKKVTARTALLPRVEGTNMSCSFSHIFAGGYSAGYYSYKWAEVLDADAFELFKEKGLFNREVAQSFRENILSRGGTQHPMELYKKFRGREPDPDALLRRDGLIDPKPPTGDVRS